MYIFSWVYSLSIICHFSELPRKQRWWTEICQLSEIPLKIGCRKIKIYNLKNTVWSLVYFVTVVTKWSTKNMSPSIVSRDLGHSITDVWDKLPHSQSGRGINLLRVFVFSASWENLFLVATVRSTDAKKTYCLEANPNPEGYFSFFYFSSKSTLRLLLGGLLCLRM